MIALLLALAVQVAPSTGAVAEDAVTEDAPTPRFSSATVASLRAMLAADVVVQMADGYRLRARLMEVTDAVVRVRAPTGLVVDLKPGEFTTIDLDPAPATASRAADKSQANAARVANASQLDEDADSRRAGAIGWTAAAGLMGGIACVNGLVWLLLDSSIWYGVSAGLGTVSAIGFAIPAALAWGDTVDAEKKAAAAHGAADAQRF